AVNGDPEQFDAPVMLRLRFCSPVRLFPQKFRRSALPFRAFYALPAPQPSDSGMYYLYNYTIFSSSALRVKSIYLKYTTKAHICQNKKEDFMRLHKIFCIVLPILSLNSFFKDWDCSSH